MDRGTELLRSISALSAEFGSRRYVRGGGGNTSCKDAVTLWVKPSGTALADMTPERFVVLDRGKLAGLYSAPFPAEEKARESAVKDYITGTILPGQTGRPSVEAPLHNVFPQTFVVHTHPSFVNGLTCGRDAASACRRLFPNALFIPFVEPGYILCMRVREEMLAYEKAKGASPEILVLGNHGVFVAHDSVEGVRRLYREVMEKVENELMTAGVAGEPARGQMPSAETIAAEASAMRAIVGDAAAAVAASGAFAVPPGAISPDHIVYSKSAIFFGDITKAAVETFCREKGYWPRVVANDRGVFGFGPTQKVADLALELAWDGALIECYAGAFGGIHFLEKHFIDFIEGWEVESYRQSQSQ